MKRIFPISRLVLPVLVLALASCLSAQTLVVDKPTLSFSGQFGGAAVTQTVNVSSSTGGVIPFVLVAPPLVPQWLKVSGQGNTPAAVTVTADPTGLTAGTYSANIAVLTGSGTNSPIGVTFTVSAVGVNPASLTFNYTIGSITFPAPQNLTVSGAAANCTLSYASASGGSWFTLLNTACVSPGTINVLINTSVVAGLAAGTYTGTITITPPASSLSPAVVVPLTLIVLPTPPVTVNPTALIFNYQTGIAAPNPSQTFTISTTAAQSLNYGFTSSVDNGSNWISTISPPNGTLTNGSAVITLTLNPAGLAAGTYTGRLTLFTPGGSPAQQDIRVTFIVASTPLLNVPTATLNFSYQSGTAAPASQTVNITATSGILNYTVTPSANAPWLSVPIAGSSAAPLTVSVNPVGLTPGTYTAQINVGFGTSGNTFTQQIPVVLKVTNDPTISASVLQLSFPFQLGQTAPPAQSVKLTSSTGVTLNYSAALATTTCGAAWLQLNGGTNVLNGVTNDTLTVSVATASLVEGTCSGSLTITATNPATGAAAVNSPLTIPVTLYVSSKALLVVSPTVPPVFTVGVGAQSVTPQNITLTSSNTDVLTYTVAFQSSNTTSGNWLFVAPQSGATNANNVLTISVIPVNLPAGTYSGTVTVTAAGPGGAVVANSPVTIPVTLNVTSGSLTVSVSDLTFGGTLGGPAPASQTVTVGSSNQPLNYSAVAISNNSVSWLSVTPTSGSTAGNGVLTVTVDGSKLTSGVTYNGTIQVSSPGAANSPATINVHFKVDPGTISAPTTTLTFTQAAGGAIPAVQTIAVSGNPAPLNYTVTVATQNNVNWLKATSATGTTPSSVQVQVDGTVLAVGQYNGTVTITSTGAGGSPISVPVVLNVVSPALIAASPASLSFNYIMGQSTPAAQSIVISATGATGNVPLTAAVQFDGAVSGWMVVSPTSGSAPLTFAVSLVTANLTVPGTYTGRVVITSSNALVAVTIPVTLTVTAIPQPVIRTVNNAANYSTGAVSPGENIVIFGSGVGPATLVSSSPSNNVFPTLVGATRVLFDNAAAPIIYASTGQTSVMVPYGVAGRTTTTIVVEYSGVQSAPIAYNVTAAAPGIYTLNSQGTGPGAILNQDGVTVNGLSAPEKRGNVIAIYMTGEGQTTPQGSDGAVIAANASALKKPNLPVTVTVGGVNAVVAYAGSAPGLISGVMQVNVTIPLAVSPGTQPVVVTVGTAQSQFGSGAATVVVQ